MMILICQVNNVEAKKGGGNEYHAGRIVKYLRSNWDNDAQCYKCTYEVQFDGETAKHDIHEDNIKVGRR